MKNNTISFTEDENCRSLNIEHQYNFVFEVYKEKADLVASKMSEEQPKTHEQFEDLKSSNE